MSHNIFTINSVDQNPQDIPNETDSFLKGLPQSQTGGLSEYLVLRKGGEVKTGEVARRNDNYGKRSGVTPVRIVKVQLPVKLNSHMINCKRSEFPLTLAWACAVHKVKGLNLGQVAVCLQLYKQKSFIASQLYVALCRANSLSSLSIMVDIHPNYIKSNPSVLAEYDWLRKESNFLNTIQRVDNLVITLLKLGSQKKYIKDFF